MRWENSESAIIGAGSLVGFFVSRAAVAIYRDLHFWTFVLALSGGEVFEFIDKAEMIDRSLFVMSFEHEKRLISGGS